MRCGKNSQVRTQEIFNLEECVVASSFRALFPNDFIRAHPIRVHKKVDMMLAKWERIAALIERKEYDLSISGVRPVVYPERYCLHTNWNSLKT